MSKNSKLVKFDAIDGEQKWSIRYGRFVYTYHDFMTGNCAWTRESQWFARSCLTTEERAREVWQFLVAKETIVEGLKMHYESNKEIKPIDLPVNPKYPNDTEVITIELDQELIENLNALAKMSGLCTNDMIKAILGWKMWSLGIHDIPPKEKGDES